jgi:hypothetical protein
VSLQAVKVLAVDNPAQVKGAVQRAFSDQDDPVILAGDAMHGIKRITEAAEKHLSDSMKGARTFLAYYNTATYFDAVDCTNTMTLLAGCVEAVAIPYMHGQVSAMGISQVCVWCTAY